MNAGILAAADRAALIDQGYEQPDFVRIGAPVRAHVEYLGGSGPALGTPAPAGTVVTPHVLVPSVDLPTRDGAPQLTADQVAAAPQTDQGTTVAGPIDGRDDNAVTVADGANAADDTGSGTTAGATTTSVAAAEAAPVASWTFAKVAAAAAILGALWWAFGRRG